MLTPDSEQTTEHNEEAQPMTVQTPPKRKPAPVPRAAQAPVAGDDPWAAVEAALVRISTGETSASDYSLAASAGLHGDKLRDELQRVSRVLLNRPACGTWATVTALEQTASVIATTARHETATLQDEIDAFVAGHNAKIGALADQVRDADRRAERMRAANFRLRELAPDHVKKYSNVVQVSAMDQFGAKINDLTNAIGPMRVVLAADVQQIRVAVGRKGYESAAVYDLRRTLRSLGHTFADDAAMAAALPDLQRQFAKELPKLESDLEAVQDERDHAQADAVSVLDVYLPIE